MSEEDNLEENESALSGGSSDEALEVAEEEMEEDALTEDEMDEVEEVEEEQEQEVGAVLVVGQSDFDLGVANRGAEDPSDNTLSEPQFVSKYGEMVLSRTGATIGCWSGTSRRKRWENLPVLSWDRRISPTTSRTGASQPLWMK